VTSNNDSSSDEVTETKLESLNEQLESSKLVYVTSNNDLSSDEVTETKLDSFKEEESSKLAMVRWTSNRDGTYVLREDQLPLLVSSHKSCPSSIHSNVLYSTRSANLDRTVLYALNELNVLNESAELLSESGLWGRGEISLLGLCSGDPGGMGWILFLLFSFLAFSTTYSRAALSLATAVCRSLLSLDL
jgi:hypothetical protein